MAREMNMEALNANLRALDKRGEMNIELLRRQDAAAAEKLGRIGDLIRDEQFCAAFLASESAEEAVGLFAGRGVELTVEEVTALAKQIVETAKKLIENGGELLEDELEQIAGGVTAAESVGVMTGAMAMGLAGFKAGGELGGLIGSLICPFYGTGVGAIIGAAIGGLGAAVGGTYAGMYVAKGFKKLGGWMKSLF